MTRKKNVEEKKTSFKIEDLDGIGPKRAERLRESGVETAIDILVRGSQELTQITGAKKEEAQKLVESVRQQLISEGKIPDVSTAAKYWEYRKQARFYSTGSKGLDDLLGGGIVSQALTQVYGTEGGGKTQTLHTLVCLALSQGVAVEWIECEGTFDVDRLIEIAETRGLINETNKDTFLDKLYYEAAYDTDSIERVVNTIVPKVLDRGIKLIVIDGAIGKYRLEYDAGRGDLAQRQNDIKPFLKHLQNMSELLDLAVVMTNQVMGNPDGFGEPDKPIGGHVIGHNFRYIVRFNKGAANKRIARFIKSNRHAISDVEFWLNKEGVSDVDKLKEKKEVKPVEEALLTSNFGSEPTENKLIETDLLAQ